VWIRLETPGRAAGHAEMRGVPSASLGAGSSTPQPFRCAKWLLRSGWQGGWIPLIPTTLFVRSWRLLRRSRASGHFRRPLQGRRAGRTPAILFRTTGCYRGRASGCAIRNWVRRIPVRCIENQRRYRSLEERNRAPIEYLVSRKRTSGRTRGRSASAATLLVASAEHSHSLPGDSDTVAVCARLKAWDSLDSCIVRRAAKT
jgi:hypothetical protein